MNEAILEAKKHEIEGIELNCLKKVPFEQYEYFFTFLFGFYTFIIFE